VSIPIAGISEKKIDIFTSDCILKINVKELKLVKIIDLEHEIDFLAKEQKHSYINSVLEVVLLKKEFNLNWTNLEMKNMTKQELKERRMASFRRREENDHQFSKNL